MADAHDIRRDDEDETEVVRTRRAPMRLRKMCLVIQDGERAGERVPVEKDRFTVGKDPVADLQLAEPTVSRLHLEILRRSDVFTVRDLQSTNGTAVDGTVVKEAFLSPGARITVGAVSLMFRAVYEEPGPDLEECEEFGGLVAASRSMKAIMGLLGKAAVAGTTVLLRGETGVGKSALASAIHAEGPRRDKPFVTFDCGSVAPSLVESELFGVEKGAFTGAVHARPGACEQAQGGTIFLDEIEELPRELQPKLLRVLEERQVRRLGGTRSTELDVHIIAASKIDLPAAVERGDFRRDLYYRIAVIDVEIPALRERVEDIPLLGGHFLEQLPGPYTWERLAPALREQVQRYSWPGNVRELRNVLERMQCVGPESTAIEETDEEAAPVGAEETPAVDLDRPFKEAKSELVNRFEREYIERLLQRFGGRVAPAAREAGLNRKYFYDLMKKHQLLGGRDK